MAVLADGQSRPDGRPEQSLQQLRGGEIAICDGPLPQRSEPALRRDEQAARRPALSRRRLFDRRHGELSVDRAVGAPGPEIVRLPESAALVRSYQSAAGGGQGLRMDAEDQSGPGRRADGGRARHSVWPDRPVRLSGGGPVVNKIVRRRYRGAGEIHSCRTMTLVSTGTRS